MDCYDAYEKVIVSLCGSDGQGVVTELEGSIDGVGPDKLEVSYEFVSGNSGGLLVNAKTQEVLGVATFVTRAPKADWVKEGTRFEEVRRFCVRWTNKEEWVPIAWERFRKEGQALKRIENMNQQAQCDEAIRFRRASCVGRLS